MDWDLVAAATFLSINWGSTLEIHFAIYFQQQLHLLAVIRSQPYMVWVSKHSSRSSQQVVQNSSVTYRILEATVKTWPLKRLVTSFPNCMTHPASTSHTTGAWTHCVHSWLSTRISLSQEYPHVKVVLLIMSTGQATKLKSGQPVIWVNQHWIHQ